MNIDRTKNRQPLGRALMAQEEWKRLKIRARLRDLNVTQGKWKGLLTYAEAHNLPTFIRDVIVEEIPETADLFNHPDLKADQKPNS